MIRKTVEYVDYNGVTRKEDFYFNLTEAEATELQLSSSGGLSAMLEQLVITQDVGGIVAIIKKLVIMAYGEKSLDGRRFVKSQEVVDNFVQTEAYSKIFMELAGDANKAVEFINGIMPKSITDSVGSAQVNLPDPTTATQAQLVDAIHENRAKRFEELNK